MKLGQHCCLVIHENISEPRVTTPANEKASQCATMAYQLITLDGKVIFIKKKRTYLNFHLFLAQMSRINQMLAAVLFNVQVEITQAAVIVGFGKTGIFLQSKSLCKQVNN